MIGIVYKIANNVDDRIYVGSTKGSLNVRYAKHKSQHLNNNRKEYNCKFYTAMREIGFDNFNISVLETVTCENKDELHQHEQRHIEELLPALNTQRAKITMTRKEYNKIVYTNTKARQTEASLIAEKARVKKWHTDNKEAVKEYKRLLYIRKKAEISAKHKDYYQANKEAIKTKSKAQSIARNLVTETCGCGGSYKLPGKNRHKKSLKHTQWLETQ